MIKPTPFESFSLSNLDVVFDNWCLWVTETLENGVPKRTKHRSSLCPRKTNATSHILKRLKTTQKRYRASHLSVQKIHSKTKQEAKKDKNKYERLPVASTSTVDFIKTLEVSKIRICRRSQHEIMMRPLLHPGKQNCS